MQPYHYFPGSLPVIVSIPHAGIYVPEAILERFTAPAKQLPDTDWHVDRLYLFAKALGVHMLVATHSRYVIDLNREPDGQPLYPGKFTTGICPDVLFDGTPVYLPGQAPDAREIQERIATYWQPYHRQLQSTIAELKCKHNKVVVFDAHSICSQLPLLFEGTLPDLNLGTADGKTADKALADALAECCRNSPYSTAYNGRFKGGYITRHYGQPGQGVHAIQLELAQHIYMQETHPYGYDELNAKRLQGVLHAILSTLIQWVK